MADELLGLGYIPFPPLLSHYWNELSPKSHAEWLRIDLEWLRRFDCVLRLPGESRGAVS